MKKLILSAIIVLLLAAPAWASDGEWVGYASETGPFDAVVIAAGDTYSPTARNLSTTIGIFASMELTIEGDGALNVTSLCSNSDGGPYTVPYGWWGADAYGLTAGTIVVPIWLPPAKWWTVDFTEASGTDPVTLTIQKVMIK